MKDETWLNENYSDRDKATSKELRLLNIDAVAVVEHSDTRGLTDTDVLERGLIESRIVVTMNVRDFVLISRTCDSIGRTHSGLLYVSSKKYYMGKQQLGQISAALLKRVETDHWPNAGESDFL